MKLQNLDNYKENFSDEIIFNNLIKSSDKDLIEYTINVTSDLLNNVFLSEDFKINAKKRQEKFSKKVNQYNMNGELIKTWNSTKECGRNGFNQSCVWSCCKGIYKQYKGYIWKYADEVKTNGN